MANKIETIYWHLTRQCNLRCTYCYFSAGIPDADELSEKELEAVVQDIIRINPKRVVFTGGEPLLHKYLPHLNRSLKQILPKTTICLNTNGFLINDKTATEIAAIYDEVRISVDSFEYENDQLRGKGTFKKALAAYRTLLPLNVIPRIFITVNSKNLNTLTDFMDYLINQDITNIHISPLKTIGRAQDKELLPKLEKLKKTVESYWWNKYGLRLKYDTNDCTNCGIGSFLTINPNGDIFPCHALSYNQFKIGNIKNKNLLDILENSLLFKKLSNLDLRSNEDDTHNSEIPVHLQCLAASIKINELIK